MREPKMPPGINFPVAVAIIDDLYRDTVRISIVFVEVRGTQQGRHDDQVLAMFPITGQSGESQMVVTSRGAGAAMLTPVTIRRLLDCGEASHDLSSQPLPFWLAKHLAGQINQRGPERIMIWRSANVGGIVPGEVQPFCQVGHQRTDRLFDFSLPAGSALFSQLWREQPISFEPKTGVPITVQPGLVASLLI